MPGISLLPSADQEQVLEAVRRTLAQAFPLARLQHGRAIASLSDQDWTSLAELGWLALAAPAEVGGVGYDLTDAALVHREFARALLSTSVTATAVAAGLALELGDAALGESFAAGGRRAAFALRRDRSDGCHLLEAGGADHLVLLEPTGAALVPAHAFADRAAAEGLDSTVPLERARLSVEVEPSAAAGLRARALVAAELSGVAAAAADQAVAYAKVREQFGKPIGAMQAVAHPCADAAMRAQAAIAQSNFAAVAVRDGRADAAFQVAAACQVGADAAFANATTNIKVHGGMGFSAESDCHLWLKRAQLLRRLCGGDEIQRQVLLSAGPARG